MRSARELKTLMRQMRKKPTKAERIFRERLKADGVEFIHQCIVGFYIVDFVIPARMLVIELDGSSHDGREEYDAMRDTFLRKVGFEVVRVPNDLASTIAVSALVEGHERRDDKQFRSALGRAMAFRGIAIQAARQRDIEKATLERIEGELEVMDARYRVVVAQK